MQFIRQTGTWNFNHDRITLLTYINSCTGSRHIDNDTCFALFTTAKINIRDLIPCHGNRTAAGFTGAHLRRIAIQRNFDDIAAGVDLIGNFTQQVNHHTCAVACFYGCDTAGFTTINLLGPFTEFIFDAIKIKNDTCRFIGSKILRGSYGF